MADTRRLGVVVARVVFVFGFVVAGVSMIITGSSAGADRSGVVLAVIAVVLVLLSLPFCRFRPRPPR